MLGSAHFPVLTTSVLRRKAYNTVLCETTPPQKPIRDTKRSESELWAEAVLTVAEDISPYSEAARQRAIERFDLEPWVERHRQVLSDLLTN